VGEADGDAAALLLGQPVGVGAGEGADESALAMIDLARRADNDILHAAPHPSYYRYVAKRQARRCNYAQTGRVTTTPRYRE
jgi:hypothetical protein